MGGCNPDWIIVRRFLPADRFFPGPATSSPAKGAGPKSAPQPRGQGHYQTHWHGLRLERTGTDACAVAQPLRACRPGPRFPRGLGGRCPHARWPGAALVGQCCPGNLLYLHLTSGRRPADRQGGAVPARASSGLWRGALALGRSRVGLLALAGGSNHPHPDVRRLCLPDQVGGVHVANSLRRKVSELQAVYLETGSLGFLRR
jgi:hypothetical protein